MRTFRNGNTHLVDVAESAYYFSVKGAYGETDNVVNTPDTIETPDPLSIGGGYEIVQEGSDNKFPYQLRQLLEDNNLGEGVLNRQLGLQYGQGLALYTVEYVNGKREVKWDWDEKVGVALEEFDYEDYLANVLFDYLFKREYYTKFIGNKGIRIGAKAISKGLQHIPVADCRRQIPDAKGVIKNFFVGDWREGIPEKIERFGAFDKTKGLNGGTTIAWERGYQPGKTVLDASVPKWYGARKWMQRGNVAPDILKAHTDNSMNVKYHIISPQSYWDNKREILQKQCQLKETPYKESMLEELKEETLKGLAQVLTGIDNVGKFFHSEAVLKELNIGRNEILKWEIKELDMKVKDFVDAQIKISGHSAESTASGMGLAPSLANILTNGKLASGSEKLYDYKLFLATETQLVESKVLKHINWWKQMAFPNVPGKFGFYHDIVKREEDITADERLTNNEK